MGVALPPARPGFAENAECGFADHLVHRHGVGRMEPTAANITVEPFELVALEHPAAARHVHCPVDGAEGALDAMVFCSYQLGRPHITVINTIRPVIGNA